MALVVVAIAVILIVTAIRDTYVQLGQALATDVPPFMIWAAAIIAIGALGYIPNFEKPSRLLMGLVIMVIILTNYSQIIAGFQAAPTATASAAPTDPAQALAATASATGVNWTGGGGIAGSALAGSPIGSLGTLTGLLGGGFGGGSGSAGAAGGSAAGAGFVDSGSFTG
jgi:hypothetical protein